MDFLTKINSFIEGEDVTFTAEDFKTFNKIKKNNSILVYRGLSFESKEDFKSKYPEFNEEVGYLDYSIKGVESFSLSQEQAEYFAQDLYSNFGIVIEIELSPHIILNEIVDNPDFNHEQEALSLNEESVRSRVVKTFNNNKDKIGMK